jgi:hypothetical protein
VGPGVGKVEVVCGGVSAAAIRLCGRFAALSYKRLLAILHRCAGENILLRICDLALWCNWLTRRPLKAESPGSSPGNATNFNHLQAHYVVLVAVGTSIAFIMSCLALIYLAFETIRLIKAESPLTQRVH